MKTAPSAENPGARRAPPAWLPHLVSVAVVTAIGFLARAFSVLPGEFPLNDGGLFYQMVLDLRDAWPALPITTTYNGLDIPYAYPPLGFYLGAATLDLFGGIDLMRLLPLVLSALTVPALYGLTHALLGGVLVPTAAGLAFALTPRAFEWLVMGGGLTRSLGVLTAMIAVWMTSRLLDRPTVPRAVMAGMGGGLCVLSHPQGALLAATGALLLVAARARSRPAVTAVLGAAGIALAVVLPWIALIVINHGSPAPLFSAVGTQPGALTGAFNLLTLDYSGSRVSVVVGALAVSGLILAVMRGRWLLPVWFATVMVLDSRGGAIYATVPASILAGEAVVHLVAAPFWRPASPDRRPIRWAVRNVPAAALISFFLLAAMTDALGTQLTSEWSDRSVSPEQRQAMEWVRTDGPDGTYLVISGEFWATDAVSEWFPVLSGATSAATVQGTEWLGSDRFFAAAEASDALGECGAATAACLDRWADRWGVTYDYVFVAKSRDASDDCCARLRDSLVADPIYRTAHDGPGGLVVERLGPAS